MKNKRKNKYIPAFFTITLSLLLLMIVGVSFMTPLFILYTGIIVFYLVHFKVRIRKTFVGLFLLILIYLLYGYGNPAWLMDARYSLTWLLCLVVFYDMFKRGDLRKLLKILFKVNIVILIIYAIVSMGYGLGIFNEALANRPSYSMYRTPGPPLFPCYLVPLIYLAFDLKKDKLLLWNGVVGMAAILMNGSGQNFATMALLYILIYLRFRNKKEIIKNVSMLVVISLLFGVYVTYIADTHQQDKLSNIVSPLESSTVQTRLRDLTYMIEQPRTFVENVVGVGIGAMSKVYRANFNNYALSQYREFIEIDNGFFYIFHRYGLIGLLLLFITHFKLYKRLNSKQMKIAFLGVFFFTNLLSIHYWTMAIGAFLIAITLAANYVQPYKKIN